MNIRMLCLKELCGNNVGPVSIVLQSLPIILSSISQIYAYFTNFMLRG